MEKRILKCSVLALVLLLSACKPLAPPPTLKPGDNNSPPSISMPSVDESDLAVDMPKINSDKFPFTQEELQKIPASDKVEAGLFDRYAERYKAYEEVNEDLVAILEITGTDIALPVVQGVDNEEYLRKGFDGEYSLGGTLMLDQDCGSTSNNDIIYGHNMYTEGMFTSLSKFKDKDTFDNSLAIYAYMPSHMHTVKVYKPIAVYETTKLNEYNIADPVNAADIIVEEPLLAHDKYLKSLDEDSQVLTLSTCVEGSDKRLVVQFLLVNLVTAY